MKNFFDENIFLDNEYAKELYTEVKDLPIFDYHCHLSPKEIAENRVFKNLGELWLEGDHYKWRIMRGNGVDEKYITGNADWYEKFSQFAKSVEYAAGNPVYHWIHFELKKYFGINKPLNSETCDEIWNKTLDMMKDGSFSAKSLIERSNVEKVFTTDDPADSLEYHAQIAKSGFKTGVFPTFRPDKAICAIGQNGFSDYIEKLGKIENTKIDSIDSLCKTLKSRLEFFVKNGCKCADISFTSLPFSIGTKDEANNAFVKAISGNFITEKEKSDFSSFVFVFLSNEYAKNGVTSQIHLSALRNNDKKLFEKSGPDVGNDSVGKTADIYALSDLFNAMTESGNIPKTILYTLNHANYYELATMAGNFWGENGGNIQLGAAWWFCDHREGIIEQLKIFSQTGIIGKFNGMLTDSRSFTSYTRHDYFRRILCSYIGNLVESGEYDINSAKSLVKKVSIENARKQFC